MLAMILPILNTLLGNIITPFVNAWVNYKQTALQTGEAGFEAAARADAQVMTQALSADIQLQVLKVQVYGHWINRAVMWIAGLPAAIHFGLVFIDTILAAPGILGHPVFGVPKLPAPYDTYEWAIVSSFFLIQAVHVGATNVTQWLNRK